MHTLTNAAHLTALDNLWGVVYFGEDGTVLCTDFLEATDYCDAADQAMEDADGGAFQLFEGLDVIGPLAPPENLELFGVRQSQLTGGDALPVTPLETLRGVSD